MMRDSAAFFLLFLENQLEIRPLAEAAEQVN